MASVFCIGSETWSKPSMLPVWSRLMREAVQPCAVGRDDLAAVHRRQSAQRLLDRLLRVGEGAVGVRVVRGPHARVGSEERDERRAQRVLLEGGEHLAPEQLARP